MIARAQVQMAFMALTRLPVGEIRGQVPTLVQSAWAFPLIGALIGGLGALPMALAPAFNLSPVVSAGLSLLVMIWVTGALHEDGLADFADSAGSANRARKLEIMRDSRIGSYGVIALVLGIGLRWGAMIDLPALALVLPPVISRTLVVFAIHHMPPARDDGLGRLALGGVARNHRLAVSFFVITFAMAFGPAGLIALCMAAFTALAVAGFAMRMLGGQTGDVFGALILASEIVALIALSSLL